MKVATLGYALLGLLARESLSGYDLAQQLRGRVAYFWQARHSQIYPELARLEEQGLVEHRVVEQQDRPDKKLYSITEVGLNALRRWVTEQGSVSPIRDELVLKTFSIWLAGPREAARLYREHERRHREQLAHYEGIQARLEGMFGQALCQVGNPTFATYLTLQCGIGHERQYADWCRWVAEQLEQGDVEEDGVTYV